MNELNIGENIFRQTADENCYEYVILTATHDIEFQVGKPLTEYFPETSVKVIMQKKFSEAKNRETAYLAGQFELI